VEKWGWGRTNEWQGEGRAGEGVKGLSSTFELSAIGKAKV